MNRDSPASIPDSVIVVQVGESPPRKRALKDSTDAEGVLLFTNSANFEAKLIVQQVHCGILSEPFITCLSQRSYGFGSMVEQARLKSEAVHIRR